MRIQLTISRNLAFLSLLGALCGCAATNASVMGDKETSQSSAPVIRDIRVTGEGDNAQVSISANRPLAYTFYMAANPPKAVVDLAQVQPGAFSAPMEINAGNIKRIATTRVGEGEAAMTRVEVFLARDAEMTAATDPADKGTMRLAFVPPPVPASAAPAKAEPPAPAAAPEPVAPQPANTPVAAERKIADAITAITPRKDSLEIRTTGEVADFKTFRLTKPDRLVLDVFGVKAALAQKVVPVNSLGIETVRVGAYPDKVRLVLDASGDTLPAFTVEKTAAGLAVVPSSSPAAVAAKSRESEQTTPALVTGAAPKAEAKPVVHAGAPEVDSIEFKVVDAISRIAIETTAPCNAEKPVKSAEGLTLTLKNCILPRKWQRHLDTSAFASVVQKVTPYQVKVKGRHDVKVQVALRRQTSYELRREGGVIYLDLKNPVDITAAPVASEPAKQTESERSAPVVVKSQAVSPTAAADGKKVYTGRRVTLEFSDADIRKIFQLIAEVSNLNFIVGDDVTGTISLKLVNVPWDQALDVILENKGLGMQRDGNIVQIRPKSKIMTLADEEQKAKKSREQGMELKTEVFDVNYAAVGDVVTQFNTLKSERGMISQDARTNRVIVKDIAPVVAEMRNLLKSLDIPEKQVMIEARIVEASSTVTQELGIQWGIHARDANTIGVTNADVGFGGILTGLAPTAGTFGPGAAAGITFGKLISGGSLDLKLSALASGERIKIISSPKVVTLNNKAAKISQGQSIPYSTVSAEGTKTEFVEAALTLEVTPHIASDGSISMKIKATNNSAAPAPTGAVPAINKKEATTELLVRNGETTVIGGIYVDNDSQADQGVPFFKDIPLLGWLFKSSNTQKIKNELLIFITPKIVL
ncbi:type IV pilus secretin PilQ [Geobacter metallireducens RCH3]|uniref:Type IV pilus secretin lipoprotein PilQ n=1 Tax=Geobacter metallireducens (strain ATCC 53774 / DSM 7210 / GS-15) TaxID=269799 RepID=Q39X07_GEOMG|nr:type IV pilus secretin family protein [Geobacter metallireducens]ABB31217.1 type IV pilus secretin lipoprotein PilQ [Geobacter metallireducens GS-15]EHP84615.1 type IV pilus secretin PilQ [Geobacter metallireducens RCH3]